MGGPPHSSGGRAYASGGGVASYANTGTYMSHTPGKNDGSGLNRGKPVTYATGGPVYSQAKGQMGPKFGGGALGGTAKKQKAHRAARVYKKAV